MKKTNFKITGIPMEVMQLLKKTAKGKMTVNALILQLIEQGIGYSHVKIKPIFDDLDSLAGTWSEQDVADFKKNSLFL
jgi:hypothetical protein